HGVNGPWSLKGLSLADVDIGTILLAKAGDWATAGYLVGKFQPPAPPKIRWLEPSDGPFAGGLTSTGKGGGLQGGTGVRVGANEAAFQLRDDEALGVTIPPYSTPAPVIPPGQVKRIAVDLRVTTRWGSDTSWNGFTYSNQ